jgi:hypothetical protein
MTIIILGIGIIGFAFGQYMRGGPKEKLKQDAQKYFELHVPAAKPDLSSIAIKAKDTPAAIAEKLLKNQKGLVIGETHSHTAPKYFLYHSLEAMKREGVNVLGLEIQKEYQKDFDDYIFKKTDAIPSALQKRLDTAFFKLNKKHYYNTEEIIEKARQVGIRIVCIDAEMCKADLRLKPLEFDFERRSLMNYNAFKTISPYLEKGKFVILTGLGHACPFDKPKVPSLGSMLGVPSVYIKDTNEWIDDNNKKECFLEKQEHPSFTVSIGSPTLNGGHPDITLETDPIVKHDSPDR